MKYNIAGRIQVSNIKKYIQIALMILLSKKN